MKFGFCSWLEFNSIVQLSPTQRMTSQLGQLNDKKHSLPKLNILGVPDKQLECTGLIASKEEYVVCISQWIYTVIILACDLQ